MATAQSKFTVKLDGAPEAVRSLKSIRDEAKAVESQLSEIAVGSAEFDELLAQLSRLKGELREVRGDAKGLTDEGKLAAIGDIAQGIAGGFAAAEGAAALFGEESEKLQETLLKVNSALVLLSGVQSVVRGVMAAEDAFRAFSVASTAALGPLGLFLAAASAIGVALVALNKHLDETASEQERLAKAYADSNDEAKQQAELTKRVNGEAAKELATFDALYKTLQKTNEGSAERREVVETLQKQYPGYLKNIDLERASQDRLAEIYGKVRSELLLNIRAKAAAAEADRLVAENQATIIEQAEALAELEKELAVQVKLNAITQAQAGKVIQAALGGSVAEVNNAIAALGESFSVFNDKLSSGGQLSQFANRTAFASAAVNTLTDKLVFLSSIASSSTETTVTAAKRLVVAFQQVEDAAPDIAPIIPEEVLDIQPVDDYFKRYEELGRQIQEITANGTENLTAEQRKRLKLLEAERQEALRNSNGIYTDAAQNERKLTNATKEELAAREEARQAEAEQARATYFQLANAALGAFSQVNALLDEQGKNRTKALDDELERIDEITQKTEEQITDSQGRLAELTDNLATAQADQRAKILDLIDKEADKEKQLQAQKAAAAEQEKRIEEEKKQIAKQQFERAKALQIAQTIIATAQAVMQAYAAPVPGLPGNLIFAGLAAATGAAQVATIAAQQPGFAGGGFTGAGHTPDPRTPGHRIAGYVHNDEYVVPTRVLKQPRYRDMVMHLEAARLQGHAAGGFAGTPALPAMSATEAKLDRLIAAAERQRIAVPVQAVTEQQGRVAVARALSSV